MHQFSEVALAVQNDITSDCSTISSVIYHLCWTIFLRVIS